MLDHLDALCVMLEGQELKVMGHIHSHRMKMFLFGCRYTLRGDVIYGCTLLRDVVFGFRVLHDKLDGTTSSEGFLVSCMLIV